MSVFANGNGSLKSTTLPAAFLECGLRLLLAQKKANEELGSIASWQLISMQLNINSWKVLISASIPVVETFGTTTPFLNSLPILGNYDDFDPGVGGDLNTTSLVQAFLELSGRMIVEQAQAYTFWKTEISVVEGVATITSTLPLEISPFSVVAVDFLG
jgi:hypothetical protein